MVVEWQIGERSSEFEGRSKNGNDLYFLIKGKLVQSLSFFLFLIGKYYCILIIEVRYNPQQ